MPVIDPVIVAIIPDDSDTVGTGCFNVDQPRSGGIFQLDGENFRVGFGGHFFVAAPALGAGTGRPQQGKRVQADVTIAPGNSHLGAGTVGGDVGRMFVHYFIPLVRTEV